MGFVRTQFDHARLGEYLGRQFGSPVTVRKTRQTFPGISRETWLVDAEIGGAAQGLVVRIDPPEGGSCPASLHTEWEVYRRLWGSAVPVAEPLWFDAAADFTDGRPLMVRRLVEGSAAIPGLNEAGAQGDAAAGGASPLNASRSSLSRTASTGRRSGWVRCFRRRPRPPSRFVTSSISGAATGIPGGLIPTPCWRRSLCGWSG